MKFNMGLNSPVLFDRLAYTYLPNSNKLQKVVDTVSAYYNRGEFKNGTAQGYDYDESGNLTKDLSKDISKITYTWFNKPQTITYSNGNSIEYVYDAGGNKLRESITEGGTNKKLDYQGGAYLEKGELQFVNTPAGRTNLKNPGEKEEFFIKDHLGNVRAIIADVEPPVVIIGPGGLRYAAGYEAQDAITEEQFFNSISAISEPKPNSTSSNDVKAALLDSAQMVGTSILLKVMAGDRLKINADNFYNELSSAPEDANGIETAMGQVLGSLSVGADGNTSSESPSVSELLGNSVDPASLQTAYDALQASGMDSTKPRSFLNYLFFDENMKLIPEQSHLWQADGEANWSQVGTDAQEDIEARQSGYVVVYLSNQSNAPVYFDNLVVTMEPGALLEERHYYPYGLPIQGWGSSAAGSLTNRQRYQSNEYREEAGLNWMDFHNRQYDPQIGRFLGIDPLADDVGQRTLSPYLAMGANPACNVDPLGLQFNPVQDMPRGGGLSSPGVAFVDGGWVVMGAWAMAFGKNSSMQAIIDVLSNADNNRGNANAEKAVAEFQVIALGASKGQRGNVGSNSVSSTATGPDGADASKDGGGTSLFTKGGYKLVVGFNDKERFGIWYKFVGETKEWNDWIDQQDIVDRFLIKVPQHVDNFDGFFGKVSWVLGSSVGRGRYNWDGDFVGLAPMCGTPPVPSFTRIKLASAFGTVSKLWSSTKNLSSAENAFAHFLKHGDDFDEFYNATQYVNGARSFLTNSPVGTLIKTRPNGDILKYLPSTNTFGVMNASGIPRTMFRPTSGMGYWLKQ